MIEFGFKVKQQTWQQIEIESQTISYEVIKTPTYRKFMKELPLVTSEIDGDSYFTIVSLASSIKETLLGLFSPHKKEFQLRIVWSSADENKYEAIFFALIPLIEQK